MQAVPRAKRSARNSNGMARCLAALPRRGGSVPSDQVRGAAGGFGCAAAACATLAPGPVGPRAAQGRFAALRRPPWHGQDGIGGGVRVPTAAGGSAAWRARRHRRAGHLGCLGRPARTRRMQVGIANALARLHAAAASARRRCPHPARRRQGRRSSVLLLRGGPSHARRPRRRADAANGIVRAFRCDDLADGPAPHILAERTDHLRGRGAEPPHELGASGVLGRGPSECRAGAGVLRRLRPARAEEGVRRRRHLSVHAQYAYHARPADRGRVVAARQSEPRRARAGGEARRRGATGGFWRNATASGSSSGWHGRSMRFGAFWMHRAAFRTIFRTAWPPWPSWLRMRARISNPGRSV